jgi:hypothetical protein
MSSLKDSSLLRYKDISATVLSSSLGFQIPSSILILSELRLSQLAEQKLADRPMSPGCVKSIVDL